MPCKKCDEVSEKEERNEGTSHPEKNCREKTPYFHHRIQHHCSLHHHADDSEIFVLKDEFLAPFSAEQAHASKIFP